MTVDQAVTLISKNVLKYLEDQGKKELFVGKFDGPKTSGGRLLENKIRDGLKEKGVKVLEDEVEASWVLKGQLSTDTSRSPVVRVKLELQDSRGATVLAFTKLFRDDPEVKDAVGESLPDEAKTPDAVVPIDKTTEIPKIVGGSFDNVSPVEKKLGRKADAPASDAQDKGKSDAVAEARLIPGAVLAESIENPSFFAEAGTRVRASEKSGFGIEIRACPTDSGPFVPVKVVDRGGRAFVNLSPGQFFQVHVFNNEKYDVGMELRMDGINTMHFQEGAKPLERENGKWLIRAGSQGVAVKGWFINPKTVDRFILKPEPDSVAASLSRPHALGTIHASFFMARMPSQGQSNFDAVFGGPRNDAVGRGAPTEFNGQMEERVFESRQALAGISILYRNPTPPDLPPAAPAQ